MPRVRPREPQASDCRRCFGPQLRPVTSWAIGVQTANRRDDEILEVVLELHVASASPHVIRRAMSEKEEKRRRTDDGIDGGVR